MNTSNLLHRSHRSYSSLLPWLCCAMLLLFAAIRLEAIIASPSPVALKQPNGLNITLNIRGDEWYSWFEDLNGYMVVLDQGQYVYATSTPTSGLIPTALLVGRDDPASSQLTTKLRPSGVFLQAQRDARVAMMSPDGGKVSIAPAGTVKNLVILCRFSDHTLGVHTRAPADYSTIMNKVGGDPALAPTGSLLDYYKEASYGTMTLTSAVIAWVTLPHTQAYYAAGSNGFAFYPTNAQRMVEDALNAANATVNFGQFDADNDGFVDAIDIIHSGWAAETGGGGGNWIWSHRWGLPSNWSSGDTNGAGVSVKVNAYHTEAALWGTSGTNILRVGVIAHETGHFFGLPDLYDTDNTSEGIGSWCLMANSWGFDGTQQHPPHPSAWCKTQLGWVAPTVIGAGTYNAPRSETIPLVYRINNNYPASEYLLIENRQPVGFENNMPQGGLAIWHIDDLKANNRSEGFPGQPGWPGNNNHYKVALLQADGIYEMEKGLNRGNGGDVYHGAGISSIGTNTTPNTHRYQGGTVAITSNLIYNISASASNMTFSFSTGGTPGAAPTIVTPPASQTVLAGSDVTLSVLANGTPTLSYRWRSNGVTISGATSSSLILNDVTTNASASYSVVVTNSFGSITSAPAVLTVTQAVSSVAYVRSTVGAPWGVTANETAMNTAFGAGNWLDLRYESINPVSLFAPATRFVFLEGGDSNADELEAFLFRNRVLIESWVAAGGSLFINAAPNEGDGMNFLFGVSLNFAPDYSLVSYQGLAARPSHPIFNGPSTPVGAAWSGSGFAHATVSGAGLTALITNDTGGLLLAERSWGLGRVLFGGMTTPNFHSPSPQGLNLRANILAYGGVPAYKPYVYMRSSVAGAPWGSTANETQMDRVFGVNGWSDLRYETVSVGALFTSATRFIFMEGSDAVATELEAFLTANTAAVSNWVAAGGSLFLNAAPNEDNGMNFGFGVTLTYLDAATSAGAAAPAHPIFNTPYTPVGTVWTGGSFSHASVSGTGLTTLITNTANSHIVLGSKAVGAGCVLFGGMTTPNFHSPATESANLRGNIIAFGRNWLTNLPPVIDVPPLSQSALIGQTVVFNVTAIGSPVLTYQWYKNGSPITGSNASTLAISPVTAASAAQYAVRVTNPYGTVLSDPATLTVTLSTTNSVVYLRSAVGAPWGVSGNETAMNRVFGTGNWLDARYESVNVAALFSPATKFIFMEGGDSSADEFKNFIAANTNALQNWVSSGGGLFLNAAPNEGTNIVLGFGGGFGTGTLLTYPDYTGGAVVSTPSHPIFGGPFLPVGSAWTGTSFGHATVSGGELTLLITNSSNGRSVLSTKPWGAGTVVFGGLTTPNFHSPATEAANLRANILAFIAATSVGGTAPVVVTPPPNRVVPAFAPASFDVGVVGTLPLTYQWHKNGTPIPGQTNATLTLPSATLLDVATYTVLVSNTFGVALSPGGTLSLADNSIVYVRSVGGRPWGSLNNDTALDSAFGAGNWQQAFYESAHAPTLFSPAVRFVFMDGSDFAATELETFLNANRTAMENWVAVGGLIFINSAPNEDNGMYLGFGATLRYPEYGNVVGARFASHPVVQGPFLPVGTAWTGGAFAHSYITGDGVSVVVTNEHGHMVLGEKNWGTGHALFGGMTQPDFQGPSPHAQNLLANILAYANGVRSRVAYVRSTAGQPWGVNENEQAMDRAFGAGNWQDLRYETLNVAALLSSNTRFIFMEGSDQNAFELETFLGANGNAISNWVAAGGSLFLNAAPNEDNGMSFGFGVTLAYPGFSETSGASLPAHPILNGPFLPVGTQWTGDSFAHASVSGAGLVALITNTVSGAINLAEKSVGAGRVLFGGMTTPNFHSPGPETANLRANILAYGAHRASVASFGGGAITIPSSGAATPYPSIINITGLPGVISKVTVTLSNITHTWPADIDVLLVSPHGERVMVMSDVTDDTSGPDALNVTLTLDDAAADPLLGSGSLLPGVYLPTDIDPTETMTAPAPARPYAPALAAFNGFSPNGNWSLFVSDDVGGDSGSMSGWSLSIQTVSVRPILLVPRRVGANLEVTFRSGAGPYTAADLARYQIEGSNDLQSWVGVPATLSLNAGNIQFTQPIVSAYRYYRVLEP